MLENNRGVHLKNRFMKLKYITKKDLAAIKITRSFKIKNFSLSFTNSVEDINNFIKLLPKEKKIYRETVSKNPYQTHDPIAMVRENQPI